MNAAPKQTPAPSRMTLAGIVRGRLEKPRRILVQGVEGVGKSSFAADAPKPIFICPEDGTSHLDVARFPEPHAWTEVLDAVEVLRTETHDYEHVVFDTLDWLEPIVWQHVCQREKQESITDLAYGRGYALALAEWRLFVSRLEQLRAQRGMHVIFLAHTTVKNYKNPQGPDYDRFEMKLHGSAAGFLREWVDIAGFAAFETYAHEDRNKRVRGVSTGARLLFTQRSAAYDAKNRFDLPPQLPLDWQAFSDAIAAHRPADPETLKARIDEALAAPTVTDDLRDKVRAAVALKPTDGAYLARVLNKLAATISGQENAK